MSEQLPPKTSFIRIGDFFFKHRNHIVPVFLVLVFAIFPPPDAYFGHPDWVAIVATAGYVLVAAGLLLRAAVIGFAYIKRGGLNKEVYADTLVTAGFFAVCRNPLYVGNMLVYSGVFLRKGGLVVIIGGPLLFFFLYSAIIAAEEYFLRAKFGPEYEAYCRRAPRWGIRVSRLGAALEGMNFRWRRVISKDYTTFANAALALVVIDLIEQLYNHGTASPVEMLAPYALPLALIGIVVATIRTLKKRTTLLEA